MFQEYATARKLLKPKWSIVVGTLQPTGGGGGGGCPLMMIVLLMIQVSAMIDPH